MVDEWMSEEDASMARIRAVTVSGEAASFSKIVFKFEVVATSNAAVSTATLAAAVHCSKHPTLDDDGQHIGIEQGQVFNNLRTDVPTISE